jgi:Ca2+-binding RTX toxin-like protein
MRRIMAMLSAMTVMVVLATGVAFAADIDCLIDACVGTKGDDQIRGTENPETISALAGNDFVFSRGGDYTIYLENEKDRADGAGGNDTIYGGAGNVHYIDCGEGKDTVYYDVGIDTVTNCEVLNPPTTTPSV